MAEKETIVALSTPAGRSGIGVIRLSGPHALALLRELLGEGGFTPEPARVLLKTIREPGSGDKLDTALVTYFQGPRSFTGEDVVEISCHGSPPLLAHIIDLLLSLGARAADPGEFTFRALLNGRLNLTQAEAVRDLIDARTRTAVRQAARQLGGEFSARLQPFKNALIEIITPLESSLEFVEDDLPDDLTKDIASRLGRLSEDLNRLANTFRTGKLLKDGVRVTLAGRPNAGKSSVFNNLVCYSRAIVTDIPGTTRDTISELINLNDVPVLLTDTAGIRNSTDPLEQLGIERTHQSILDADLTILVLDGTQPLSSEDLELISSPHGGRLIIALNKCDLPDYVPFSARNFDFDLPVLELSAISGQGMDRLRAAIIDTLLADGLEESDFLITNARHFDLLRRAADAIVVSETLMLEGASEELVLSGLYSALRSLGEITGETTPEQILTHIFSTFCIGK